MKKIMFNDKYGLTEAVLQGRKTMTRRVITPQYEAIKEYNANCETYLLGELDGETFEVKPRYYIEVKPRYYIGEVVAVAQSYGAILNELENPRNFSCMEHWESKSSDRAKYAEMAMYSPGGNNKMFVKADLMPNRIRITDIKVERLQDISDEDVYKEGFSCVSVNNGWGNYANHWEAMLVYYDRLGRTMTIQSREPRDAFAALIDKVSGKGTWQANPWVFAYSFELVK